MSRLLAFPTFADAIFSDTPGCGLHGFGKLRIGLHHRIEHDLTARSRGGGTGLAESTLSGLLDGRGFGGLELCLDLVKLGFGVGYGVGIAGLILLGGHGCGNGALVIAFALLDGGLERTQSNLGRAQIGHLVDFQHGVHVGLVRKDFGHLIRGDGVKTAAEGVELHEFEPRIGGHEVGGRIQSGMVGPLIGDAQWHLGHLAVTDMAESVGVLLTRIFLALGQEFAQGELLPRLQFTNRILGEHHHAERADGFRNAMIDFRIDMIGPARKHDAAAVVFLHVGERLQALHLHVVLEHLVFGVGGLNRGLGFLAGHVSPGELLDDTVDHKFVVGHVEVRAHVAHAFLTQFGHVRTDDHRIVGHDRTVVMVVGVRNQVLLI